jgi:hypothetical protein
MQGQGGALEVGPVEAALLLQHLLVLAVRFLQLPPQLPPILRVVRLLAQHRGLLSKLRLEVLALAQRALERLVDLQQVLLLRDARARLLLELLGRIGDLLVELSDARRHLLARGAQRRQLLLHDHTPSSLTICGLGHLQTS